MRPPAGFRACAIRVTCSSSIARVSPSLYGSGLARRPVRPMAGRACSFKTHGGERPDHPRARPANRHLWSSLPDTNARLYDNHSISPRAGVAWDIASDHGTVVRAHYGHYNEGIYTGLYAFLDPLAQVPTITARVLGPGQFEEISRRRSRSTRRHSIRMPGTCTPRSISRASSAKSSPGCRSRRSTSGGIRGTPWVYRHRIDMDAGGSDRPRS